MNKTKLTAHDQNFVVFVSQDENKWYVQNSFQMLEGEYIACFQIEREADEYARLVNAEKLREQ